MSSPEQREKLITDVLDHMTHFHSSFNTVEVFETCVYSIYVQGNMEDLYERFVEQLEERYGHERGLETRSVQVKAKYYIGRHLPGCVLEINHVKPVDGEEKQWEVYTPINREIIYVER